MGKIRIKTFGDEASEQAEKIKAQVKREQKKARDVTEEQTDLSASENLSDSVVAREISGDQATDKKPVTTETQKKDETLKRKKQKFIKKKQRSAKYKTALLEIDKNKIYSLSEAIELLRKVKMAKFDETVELHINTTQAGISGQVKLPHGTGKEIRIAIASDELLSEIESGKIDFDILIAEPAMMAKLAKVAKVLGPKGLMPNPKNGTISENPQEAMKKFQGGQIHFKTESKVPLMHVSVGKTSFEDRELSENIKTMITAVKKERIRNITLKSTMSPGIKLQT